MPTSKPTARHYRLACRRCQRAWDATYQMVAYHHLKGGRELLLLHGVAPTPAWAGLTCPHCGGQRITILPAPVIRPPRRQPSPITDAGLRWPRQEG